MKKTEAKMKLIIAEYVVSGPIRCPQASIIMENLKPAIE
jgi:hypothetical protein